MRGGGWFGGRLREVIVVLAEDVREKGGAVRVSTGRREGLHTYPQSDLVYLGCCHRSWVTESLFLMRELRILVGLYTVSFGFIRSG